MPQFDVAAAKKAGYTDAQIADFLASEKGFDASAAREAGYDDAQLVSHLSSEAPTKSAEEKVTYKEPEVFRGFDPKAQAEYEAKIGTNRPTVLGTEKPDETWYGSFGRGLTGSAVPTATGGVGAVTGGAIGALFGPLAPVTVPLGMIGGGILGGVGGNALQEEQFKRDPLLAYRLGQGEEQRRVDEEKHPGWRLAGQFLPGFALGRPQFTKDILPKGAGLVTKALSNPVTGNLAAALLGGGVEVAAENATGEQLDPTKIAVAAGMTAAQRKGWGLGNFDAAKLSPLQESLLKSKSGPTGEATDIVNALKEAGASPAPYEFVDPGTRANIDKAISSTPQISEIGAKYAESVQTQTPSAGQGIVSQLAPSDVRTAEQAVLGAERTGARVGSARTTGLVDSNLTTPELEAMVQKYSDKGIEREAGRLAPSGTTRADLAAESEAVVKAAGEEATPEVRFGSAGSKVSERLNAERDAAWSGVNQAYDEARTMGDAFVTPESGNEIIQSIDKALGPAKRRYKTEIPSTMNILGYASELIKGGKPKIQDLFDVRSDLTAIMGDKAGTPDAAAAREMRTALDKVVDDLDAGGMIVGDPSAVAAWRNAINARREFGTKFEGNDIIKRATSRTRIGGEEAVSAAPEDLENLIFGKGTVSASKGMVRNLTALRDRLPAEDWDALRQAGVARIFGKDAGGENFGKAFAKFQKENPDLADILFTPADVERMSGAQKTIQSATAAAEGLTFGTKVMSANREEFANTVKNMSPDAINNARISARQDIMDAVQSPEGVRRIAKMLSSNESAKANLRTLFGDKADELISMATMGTKAIEDVSGAKSLMSLPASDFGKVISGMTGETKSLTKIVIRNALKGSVSSDKSTLTFMENIANDSGLQSKLKTLFGEKEAGSLISNANRYVERKGAQSTASSIMSTNPTDFANSVSAMGRSALRDARVAARQVFRDAMNRPGQSAGMLEKIATGKDTQDNIIALFGEDEGRKLIRSSKALSERYAKSTRIKAAPVEAQGKGETQAIGAIVGSALGAKMGPIIEATKLLLSLGVDKKRAEQLATDAFDPNKADETLAFIEKLAGKSGAQKFGDMIAHRVAKRDSTYRNVTRTVGSLGQQPPAKEEKPEEKAKEPAASTVPEYDVDYLASKIESHEGLSKNPTSSAVGPFQFVSGTLAETYNQMHPDQDPITPEQADAMRADGRITDDDLREMGKFHTQKNIDFLVENDLPITAANVYLMHFAGRGATPRVIAAEPTAPITDVLSADQIAANSNIEFEGKRFPDFTVQDLRDWANDVML